MTLVVNRKLPGDNISINLKKFQNILCFFSVLGFFFGCEGVIRNKKRMVASSYYGILKELKHIYSIC